MKRRLLHLSLLGCILLTEPAVACKALVQFPEHLTIDAQTRGEWYVVEIESQVGAGYAGRITQSFGGVHKVNKPVMVEFVKGEEPQAVCPIEISPGGTYLVRAVGSGEILKVSQFNWLNVSSTHERFPVYVRDLAKGG